MTQKMKELPTQHTGYLPPSEGDYEWSEVHSYDIQKWEVAEKTDNGVAVTVQAEIAQKTYK